MADFSALQQQLVDLRTDIQAEAAQINAKLDELAVLLQQDMADQDNVDAASATVAELRSMVSGLVPDVPQP